MPFVFTPQPEGGPPTMEDRANFPERGDAWVLWESIHAEELIAYDAYLVALANLQALSKSGTSTTSLTINTSQKTLTTQSGKGWQHGDSIYSADAANNMMLGLVDSYTGTTLVFTPYKVIGSGTAASWTIGPSVLDGTKNNPSQTTPINKGNSGAGPVTFNVVDGEVQLVKNTATHSWVVNFPAGHSEIEIIVENPGAFAITMPSGILWAKGDGTYSTTFSTMGVTLQVSGKNHILLWSPDGGTTKYGKAI